MLKKKKMHVEQKIRAKGIRMRIGFCDAHFCLLPFDDLLPKFTHSLDEFIYSEKLNDLLNEGLLVVESLPYPLKCLYFYVLKFTGQW